VGLIRNSFRDVAERFKLTAENCPTHPSNCQAHWVASDLARNIKYFILESDGMPCGCVALELGDADNCHLRRLAVLPEHRQRGFGSALVHRVVAKAREMGVKGVELRIVSDHVELREWYERRGFVATGSERFPHLPFEVTLMHCQLRSGRG